MWPSCDLSLCLFQSDHSLNCGLLAEIRKPHWSNQTCSLAQRHSWILREPWWLQWADKIFERCFEWEGLRFFWAGPSCVCLLVYCCERGGVDYRAWGEVTKFWFDPTTQKNWKAALFFNIFISSWTKQMFLLRYVSLKYYTSRETTSSTWDASEMRTTLKSSPRSVSILVKHIEN